MTGGSGGRLIALEGIDGSGKSTQARRLAEALGALLTHEPGATELGWELRGLLLEPAGPPLSLRAEALLMAADRAQHVDEQIAPALASGRWVVTDRFSGSTMAYQGWGRGLDRHALAAVVTFASGGLEPDLSILVDLDPEAARARRIAGPPDRLEQLDRGFHDRVRQGFLAEAAAAPDRWAVVDGSGSVEDVAAAAAAAVRERVGWPS